jgi:phage recombination protein Bet
MELQTINYDDKQIVKTMQETVARGTTPAEFALFVQYCKATGLNPFKKEIWCIKANQGLQIMTGINGFWTIANSSKDFDGAEVGLINAQGEWVKTVPDNSFIGAWCRVYRKDRRIPMEGEALLADYAKGFGLWKTAPRIMIKKVAESIALRKAFPQELNGLYTREEMPGEYEPASETLIPAVEVKSAKTKKESKKVEIVVEPVKPSPTVGFSKVTLAEDEMPDWDAKKESNPQAVEKHVEKKKKSALADMTTYYDVSSLSEPVKKKAIDYILNCEGKELHTDMYETPIKLKRLTQCIVSKEKAFEFPNI